VHTILKNMRFFNLTLVFVHFPLLFQLAPC